MQSLPGREAYLKQKGILAGGRRIMSPLPVAHGFPGRGDEWTVTEERRATMATYPIQAAKVKTKKANNLFFM